LFYQIAHFVVSLFLIIFCRFQVEGKENFPQKGGVLVASNHRSNMDPVAVGCALSRGIHYMAKEELFQIPLLSWLVIQLKAFPIKRGGADRQAIRKALTLLQEGEVVGIFPEGTRSKNGELGTPQSGIGLLALKANCPIIPLALMGTEKPFGPIKIRIGQPILLTINKEEKKQAEEVSKEIMQEIAKLLAEVK